MDLMSPLNALNANPEATPQNENDQGQMLNRMLQQRNPLLNNSFDENAADYTPGTKNRNRMNQTVTSIPDYSKAMKALSSPQPTIGGRGK